MARDLNTKCRLCRREGIKLFLKGERCYSSRCAIVRRKSPPGVHGPKGYPKLSEYGLQLREKQKIKRSYNVSETQFKNYFDKAKKKIGNTEIDLIRMLETRLDSVVFNVGLAVARQAVRQLISHGHVLVNGGRVTVPSYQTKVGDLVTFKLSEQLKKSVLEALAYTKDRRDAHLGWLFWDDNKLEIKITRQPDIEDLPKDFNVKLVVEFYSR